MDWTACQCFRKANYPGYLQVASQMENWKLLLIKTVYEPLGHVCLLMHSALFMQVVIRVKTHEGMCWPEMQLHARVLINAISFHYCRLLWHLKPSRHGGKTDQFLSCQIKAWYTTPIWSGARCWCQSESVQTSYSCRVPKKMTDVWRWQKKHTRELISRSAITRKTDLDGAPHTENSSDTC